MLAAYRASHNGLADKLSKLVPFEVGMTLEKALEQEKQLVELIETDEEAEENHGDGLQNWKASFVT